MRVLSLAMLVVCAVANADAFTPLKSIRNRFGKKTAMPPAPSLPPVELPKGVTDKDLNDIFAINKEWIKTKESADAEYFTRMGAYHKPDYMWIGCADARVPANEVMGKDAGEVFVARNVANMVVNTDVNLMAALQYAVAFLKVSHIIVCGHYDCGGVRASMTNRDHVPPLEDWLRNIRDVYRTHRKELDSIKDPEARHRRLVELNVVEQCLNLFKTGVVQRQRVATTKEGIMPYITPVIHGVIFDPATGLLKPVEVDFKDAVNELYPIYNLYTTQTE